MNKMCIFLGNYASLTPGSSHETYKCINTTKNNHNFDLICLEELTSCPEVNAFMVNRDNKTYAYVLMEAKKVQIAFRQQMTFLSVYLTFYNDVTLGPITS